MPKKTLYSLTGKRVWVAGHDGMVGSALVRRLKKENCTVLTAPRAQVDLRSAPQVDAWLADAQPQAIFLAAARVGGIYANDTRPAEFLYDNMMIEANVIEGARKYGVEKLLFLGSSCIYPRLAPQPLKPEALLSGALEPTNQWYAVAKIAGIKLTQAYRRQYGCDFISVMPTNLYGPHDNFDPVQGHVIPALIAKLHQAKVEQAAVLEVWGSGRPMREFLYVEDAADGMVHLMQHYSGEDIVNLGSGTDISIADLAEMTRRVIGFSGGLRYDRSKPDGTPRKVLDVSTLLELGWRSTTPLQAGLVRTYMWYAAHVADEAEPVRVRA